MDAATMDQAALPPTPLSERLVDALRQGNTDEFGSFSPFSAALVVLLRALGWRQYTRELLEALPHFSDDFDLIELRNVLVLLGYESNPLSIHAGKTPAQLMPCLYVTDDERLLVLLGSTVEGIRYFDVQSNEELCSGLQGVRGTAYVLTDTQPTHGVSSRDHVSESWSLRLLKRFRKFLFHFLPMTLMINLVALAIPLFIMLVYDKVIGAKSADALPYMIAGITIALVADLGFRQLRAHLLGAIAGRLDYLIGVESFRQLLYMSPIYTERSTVAAQLQRLRQFDSVREFFTGNGATVLLELPFALLSILVIAFIAGPVAFLPLLAIVAYIALSTVTLPALANHQLHAGSARNDKQLMLLQSLSGRMEIKGIGAEDIWRERYREVSGTSAMASYKSAVAAAITMSSGQLIMTLTALGVIGWGTASVIAGEMSVGALIATLALTWRVLTPLQMGFLSVPRLQQVLRSLNQINQLMRISVEREGSQSTLLLSEIEGAITLDRVSFRYGPDEAPAILGASISARPGEIVAIVGYTGSGKSTLLKLIAGMYKPQAGSLFLDHIDIRQLNVTELRRSIAYVPQDAYFFHGTIAQNIRLNNGMATLEELVEAASEAGILQDIEALPKGFETRIGDNDTDHLPPGFIRGLALARALIRPAKVLLLDEPGSSMDEQSDRRFMETLKSFRGSRTVVMVTHRPSHARLADKCVFMDQGVVKFVGDPEVAIKAMLETD
jgi:ATP-binding cassette subfamily C protein/ATP-binding cassette subfamily C protein LapB